jgi:predicted phosphoribosyltransferase
MRAWSSSTVAILGVGSLRNCCRLALEHPVVIALPRGGVPVDFEAATMLEAPLDLLAARKLGAPGNESWELGEPPETYSTAL